jgi:ribonuclease Z
MHSTAADAARIALTAGAHRLVLTHFSARHADNPRRLERESQEIFPATVAAYDGLVVEVPLREE